MEFAQFDVLSAAEAEADASGLPQTEEMQLDIALLIASATAKGINPSLWLTEQADAGVRPFNDFTSKLISLGLAVGIQEDRDTKKELDHATSKTSLRLIYRLCKAGTDENGILLVDVALFLMLCNRRLLMHLRLLREQQQSSTTSLPVNPSSAEVHVESPIASRPVLHSPIRHSPILEEAEVAVGSGDLAVPETDLSYEDHAPSLPIQSPEPVLPPRAEELKKPPRRRAPTVLRPVAAKKLVVNRPRVSAIKRIDSESDDGLGNTDMSRIDAIAADSHAMSPSMAILRGVEVALRSTVKQTDMYHILQIHLGFLSPKHFYNTPRAQIVFSVPREWLSFTEIQHAFEMARLRLCDYHVVALYKLVDLYSGECEVQVRDSLSRRELREKAFDITDDKIREYKRTKLEAHILKAYLVCLRVTTRTDDGTSAPIPWEAWAGHKDSLRIMDRAQKPVEFEKALSGLPHKLTPEDVTAHLESFAVIPASVLEAIVAVQVEGWVVDVDCRRDFHHRVNMLLERVSRERTGKGKDGPTLRREAKENLMSKRSKQLIESEVRTAAVSKALFMRFEATLREGGGSISWRDWLDKYVEKEQERIAKIRVAARARKVAAVADHKKSACVAALITIEKEVAAAIRRLSSFHGIELRKGLNSLRKTLGSANEGTLVKRIDFERAFDGVIHAPITSGNEEVFVPDVSEALQKAALVKTSLDGTRRSEFRNWRLTKDELRKKKEMDDASEMAKRASEKKSRLDVSRKSFKAWRKLLAKDKYQSKSAAGDRLRPSTAFVRHPSSWNDSSEVRRVSTGEMTIIV